MDANYTPELESVLFDYLPKQTILERYKRARGRELKSKFLSPESSSALVANAFGFFVHKPRELSLPQDILKRGGAETVQIEQELRFPWRGGLHPWLDVVIDTETSLIGVESKRYEPFRERTYLFCEAYNRPVWGDCMKSYERLRDQLNEGYLHLDPVQLTKHAFAIREQSLRRGKKGVLFYLYAEPARFPKGASIPDVYIQRHRSELQRFAESVAGDEVDFCSGTYRQLLETWRASKSEELIAHADNMSARFLL